MVERPAASSRRIPLWRLVDVVASIAARYGTVVGVTVLVGLPLGILVTVLLARRRIRRGWSPRWAHRSAAAEVGMVLGTAPWVWMIMTPTGGAGGIRLVPFRDLAAVLSGGDAVIQVVGNLLVFAALGALLPVRFRLGPPPLVVPLVFLIAAACSSVLEILQLRLPLGRVTSTDDVLVNAFGAAVASLLSFAWWRSRSSPRSAHA
ncbi:VanZ family protein [Microbacterium sp. NPDC016588]